LFVGAAAIALLNYWLRAIRWLLILRRVGRVRHGSAVVAVAVGYAAMTLLPARISELIRPIVLARREKLPFSAPSRRSSPSVSSTCGPWSSTS
jgi:hypothetical protein